MSQHESLRALARDDVARLPRYATDSTPCAIDLSDNTNLWGSPPAALEVLTLARESGVARYPTLYSEPLEPAILDYLGLADSGVASVTGCGSDDVLDSAMRAFSRPGASIAFSAPTFSMIPVLARLNCLQPIQVPFTDGFDVDAEQLVDAGASVTYLCTPNNPTGSAASRGAVEYVIRHARGIVILDEAYAEFAPETFQHLALENDRLLVARTLSKAFGLAGLRVGFGVGAPELTNLVSRARGPYKVTSVAEAAAAAVLRPGPGARDWVLAHAGLAVANRERLVAELTRRGVRVLPSAANFVLAPFPNAGTLVRSFMSRGILVRLVNGLDGGSSALRIGVGPWDMMQALLDALDGIGSCE